MVELCALASGSNGNCYYIGNETDAVLIDAGIFYKRLVQRMTEANLNIKKIKAIFISHEHSDHIQGVRVISKKLRIPAYFTNRTFQNISWKNKPELVAFFEPGQTVYINGFEIVPFSKMHDAKEPCSFIVKHNGINTGVFTDIGHADENLHQQFSICHHVFLETNYDHDMLLNGNYPAYLKQRVGSEHGHLSNRQALELVHKSASPGLKTIFLSHISAENNTVELAMSAFSSVASRYNLLPAPRTGISEVVRISEPL
jgi:phosphoribosyl 1,2-cyclic phosphodiesterase